MKQYMCWLKGTHMSDGAKFTANTEAEAKAAFAVAMSCDVDDVQCHLLGDQEGDPRFDYA